MQGKSLFGNFSLTVPEGVTEDQVNDAVRDALHKIKIPGTMAEVYVGDVPPPNNPPGQP